VFREEKRGLRFHGEFGNVGHSRRGLRCASQDGVKVPLATDDVRYLGVKKWLHLDDLLYFDGDNTR
jgi:hypothetical protein